MSSTLSVRNASDQISTQVSAEPQAALPVVPVLDGSIFSLRTANEWKQATAKQVVEFERFVLGVMRVRFGTSDPDVIGTVTNDAFLKIGRFIDPQKLGEGGVQAFAARVIRSTAIDRNRRQSEPLYFESDIGSSEQLAEGNSYIFDRCGSRDSSPFESATFADLRGRLREVIDELDPPLKETAELMVAGQGLAEIERLTGDPRWVVRRRVDNISYSLRMRLAAYNPEKE